MQKALTSTASLGRSRTFCFCCSSWQQFSFHSTTSTTSKCDMHSCQIKGFTSPRPHSVCQLIFERNLTVPFRLIISKQRTSSLSPPESINPIVGSGDCHRDWLLLGRRGSGALELLAGLWRQNRDRSERSSFESDDSLLSKQSN